MKIILCCPRESLNSIECVLRRDRRREKTACGKKRRQIIDSGNEPWNYQYLEVSWRSFREDNPTSALTSPCGIQNQEKHFPIWLSEERFTIDSHLSAQKRIETLERHLWEVLFAWKKKWKLHLYRGQVVGTSVWGRRWNFHHVGASFSVHLTANCTMHFLYSQVQVHQCPGPWKEGRTRRLLGFQ